MENFLLGFSFIICKIREFRAMIIRITWELFTMIDALSQKSRFKSLWDGTQVLPLKAPQVILKLA